MTKNIIVTAVVALVVSVIAGLFFIGQSSQSNQVSFSGLSERDIQAVSLKIASNGTKLVKLLRSSCNLLGMDSSLAATSSAVYDCVVTGARSGDIVSAQLSTTTQNTASNLGWWITAAKASTTANYITVRVFNGTGASAVPSATAVGSSTSYLVTR